MSLDLMCRFLRRVEHLVPEPVRQLHEGFNQLGLFERGQELATSLDDQRRSSFSVNLSTRFPPGKPFTFECLPARSTR